tara:strand:+ start:2362 stop:2523 length:162 start_codon:yes stop_codon:yes gene_type:complete
MTFVFKHPKYYQELKKKFKNLGEKEKDDEASSVKPQATSDKRPETEQDSDQDS